MEEVALEVPVGEPAALPTRPRNRHKRERDVSHLCPTSVRLAQRKDEILKAWRNKKMGISPETTLTPGEEFHSGLPNGSGSKNPSFHVQVSSETDDSKDEYTLSEEEEENVKSVQNTYPGTPKSNFSEEIGKGVNCNKSGTFSKTMNIRREYW